MTQDINLVLDVSDASLDYFHKYTLQYLIELNVLRFRKKPKELECIVELTPFFQNLFKKFITSNGSKVSTLEKILQDLTKEKRIILKKSLKHDMIKLMSFELAETSLKYYNKYTLKYLTDLKLVHKNLSDDELIYELQLVTRFSTINEKICCKTKDKMSYYAQLIRSISHSNGIKLQKKFCMI